jgi:hypothetical protein
MPENKINTQNLKILLVTGSLGTTNALIPVYQELISRNYMVNVIGAGVASKIYKKHKINYTNLADNEKLSKVRDVIEKVKPVLIIIGAGGNNLIEKTFINASKILKINSFALIDNWCLPEDRFIVKEVSRNKIKYQIPDMIGVPTQSSYDELLLHNEFKNVKIIVSGMPHVENTQLKIQKKTKSDKSLILNKLGIKGNMKVISFFSAPVEDEKVGYTETSVLDALIETIIHVSSKLNYNIFLAIKPHPSFDYNHLLNLNNKEDVKIEVDIDNDDLMCISDAVLGMTTTALYESSLCNIPSYSLQIGLNQKLKNYFATNEFFDCISSREELERILFDIAKGTTRNKLFSQDIGLTNSSEKIVDQIVSNFNI